MRARRVFKTRTLKRWSRKADIDDEVLCIAVEEMARGLIDADLGGRTFKKRIPAVGRGKRGGARTIVGSNLLLAMEAKLLEKAVVEGELEEICREEESPA
ncbi:MAG TPA: type II toxin-antitoxin system RelE/ParE family toxin [Steroidobacteraceae bacterium]|nr:type II toxin-antitoxin system RelE/ParE family toxin [Steroidobacteraceae bacterium]